MYSSYVHVSVVRGGVRDGVNIGVGRPDITATGGYLCRPIETWYAVPLGNNQGAQPGPGKLPRTYGACYA